MFRKSITAVILCMSLLASMLVPAVYAADKIVDVDVGSLFDPENDITGGDNSGNTGDDSGDDNITYIPEDNVGNNNSGSSGNGSTGGGSASVVGPKEDKDDDKTTVLPTPGTTGSTGSGTTSAPVANVTFSDVKKADWFYNDVGTLVGMGVVNGYPDGTFRPDGSVTRAEFLKLLLTLMAEDSLFVSYDKVFEDVDPNEWYATYIVSAIVYGIINPDDYGAYFQPDKPITRREVAKFVVKALQVESDGYKTPYADTADQNVIALYGLGLMQGTVDANTGYRFFYPDTEISRAETSAVIHRVYKLSVDGDKYVQQFMKEHNLPALVPNK